ncbi:MAG: zinc ribbon domain-containing protein [Clostridiales bacterium]|nr:zinc ribbon domain-containing protein [Clostridiales bacterium]
MYCKNCGKKLEKDEIFCGQCGQRIVPQKEKEQGNTGLVVSIVAIALVVCAVIVVVAVIDSSKTGQDTVKTPSGARMTAESTQPSQVTDSPEAEPTDLPQERASSAVVTDQMKKELEPLLNETTGFFALMGNMNHVEDSNLARTMMAYYNLQYRDNIIDYSEKETVAKPKVEAEMRNLFGENAQYELEYRDTFPGYLYLKEDGYVRYNGGDWGDGIPYGKTLSVVSTGTDQYRLVRHVGVKNSDTGEISWYRKITCDIVKKPSGKYGYYIVAFRDYRKGDSKAN